MSRPQHLVATDLAERLRPDRNMSELLLWIPNLFAYTSYVLSMTGAYQLVVSPPRKKKWVPTNREIDKWLGRKAASENLKSWLTEIVDKWKPSVPFKGKTIDDQVRELLKEIKKTNKFLKGGNQNRSSKGRSPVVPRWTDLVTELGGDWGRLISGINEEEFLLFKDASKALTPAISSQLLELMLKRTPPAVLACWAYFYKKTYLDPYPLTANKKHLGKGTGPKLPISKLLCNDENMEAKEINALWPIAQVLLTLHAVADEACFQWGSINVETVIVDGKSKARYKKDNAQYFAERLLLDKGSLSTIHTDRCRVLPKRHNPSLGITLRSLSSNLAFHRSSVEVVWRDSSKNILTEKLNQKRRTNSTKKTCISMLLLPLPLVTSTRDFKSGPAFNKRVDLIRNHQFFSYSPCEGVKSDAISLVKKAKEELANSPDIIVLPELSMKKDEMADLEAQLTEIRPPPSVYVVGVREEGEEGEPPKTGKKAQPKKFPRNAVYCKYFDGTDYGSDEKLNGPPETPKFKQYKHHRWRLNKSQIRQYGLSQVLDPEATYWEAIKIPRRRVSFLNIGGKMTLCHLICEDLARQDPIADLIRHVGPSLVVAILLDGPQKADRWSSRYASVLSEDPGSSVITLTSIGMVNRWSSPYKSMSRVVALWSDKHTLCREIRLEQGAEAILLNLEVEPEPEVTADGREESEDHQTSVFKLVEVIQIYPNKIPTEAKPSAPTLP